MVSDYKHILYKNLNVYNYKILHAEGYFAV